MKIWIRAAVARQKLKIINTRRAVPYGTRVALITSSLHEGSW
jgi:hypothetical protein